MPKPYNCKAVRKAREYDPELVRPRQFIKPTRAEALAICQEIDSLNREIDTTTRHRDQLLARLASS